MAESFTSYSLENDAAFKATLKRASEVSEDLRIPLGLIGADFYKSQQAIFKLQGPGQYPDLSEKYKKQKQKKVGFVYPILVRTGRLSNSLLGPNNRDSIYKVTKLSLTLGTQTEYGIYHQSDKPRSKIPLRKYLFIGPEAKKFATSEQQGRLKRWTAILNDHIAKKLKAVGA
ncbi:MAG: phage virion morphogenesis protein [Pirellula sp.]